MTTNAVIDDNINKPAEQQDGAPAVNTPPAAPAPKVDDNPAPEQQAVEQWEPSGNQLVDTIAKGYLEKGGSKASFQALLDDVAESGTLTAAAKVALKDTFGDMADALIPSIEKEAKANLEWVQRERKAVYDTAGGEAKFNSMREWAAKNLDEKTRGFLTASLELGGKSAQMAVKQLQQFMIEKGETVTGETHKVNGEPAGQANTLTLAEYIAENAKLHRVGDKAGIESLRVRANAAMAAAQAKGQRWR